MQEEGGRWRLVGELAELGLPAERARGHRAACGAPRSRRPHGAERRCGDRPRLRPRSAAGRRRVFPRTRLLDLLDEAVAASLLQESPERAGRFTFTHALVEHTLYEDLGRARRARLHKRVAVALEEQCGDEPGERLGELAGHWAAAVVSTDTAKAIHYARRAAERALEQLAPDEAARWYRQALELHDQAPGGDRSERCDLLIGLGEAQRQTGNPEFRQTLLDAAQLAQELDDADRLARAVLANTRGLTSQFGRGGQRAGTNARSRSACPPGWRPAARAGPRAAGLRASLRRGARALPAAGRRGDRDGPRRRRSRPRWPIRSPMPAGRSRRRTRSRSAGCWSTSWSTSRSAWTTHG